MVNGVKTVRMTAQVRHVYTIAVTGKKTSVLAVLWDSLVPSVARSAESVSWIPAATRFPGNVLKAVEMVSMGRSVTRNATALVSPAKGLLLLNV